MTISEIANRAAESILPNHYHVNEYCYYSCPLHPEYCGNNSHLPMNLRCCDCALIERRAAVAEIVKIAIVEALQEERNS